jgi:hypothetical protein
MNSISIIFKRNQPVNFYKTFQNFYAAAVKGTAAFSGGKLGGGVSSKALN